MTTIRQARNYTWSQLDALGQSFISTQTAESRAALIEASRDSIILWFLKDIGHDDVHDLASQFTIELDRSLFGYTGKQKPLQPWNPMRGPFSKWLWQRSNDRLKNFYIKRVNSMRASTMEGAISMDPAVMASIFAGDGTVENELIHHIDSNAEREHEADFLNWAPKEHEAAVNSNIEDGAGDTGDAMPGWLDSIEDGDFEAAGDQGNLLGSRSDPGSGFNGAGIGSKGLGSKSGPGTFVVMQPSWPTQEDYDNWIKGNRKGIEKMIRCWNRTCPVRPPQTPKSKQAGGHLFHPGRNLAEDMGRLCPKCFDARASELKRLHSALSAYSGIESDNVRTLRPSFIKTRRKSHKTKQLTKQQKMTQARYILGFEDVNWSTR